MIIKSLSGFHPLRGQVHPPLCPSIHTSSPWEIEKCPLSLVNVSSHVLQVHGEKETYLSRNCQGEAVHKHHIVWDLEVRNLVEGKHIEHSGVRACVCFKPLSVTPSEAVSHLAFTEGFYLLWTGGLAVFQSDAGAHLLSHPLVFHTNHLWNKLVLKTNWANVTFCLRSHALIKKIIINLWQCFPVTLWPRGWADFDLRPQWAHGGSVLVTHLIGENGTMGYIVNMHNCHCKMTFINYIFFKKTFRTTILLTII